MILKIFKKVKSLIKSIENGRQKEEEVPDRRGQQLHQPEASSEKVAAQSKGQKFD